MLFMQRFFAVTHGIVVLDVVVNERGFMETFHRDRNLADILRQCAAGIVAQCLVGRDGQERTPAFSRPAQPFARDAFRLALRRAHDEVQ